METQEMKTLTQHLEEMGYIDQWRDQWRAEERTQLLAEVRAQLLADVRDQLLAEERNRRQSDKIETASKLKHCGVDHATIVKATGLSLREVKRLK
jgi:hypothetical protein